MILEALFISWGVSLHQKLEMYLLHWQLEVLSNRWLEPFQFYTRMKFWFISLGGLVRADCILHILQNHTVLLPKILWSTKEFASDIICTVDIFRQWSNTYSTAFPTNGVCGCVRGYGRHLLLHCLIEVPPPPCYGPKCHLSICVGYVFLVSVF